MDRIINTTGKRLLPAILAAFLAIPARVACEAGTPRLEAATIRYPISSPYYPVVLQGRNLPSLLNVPIGKIRLFAWKRSRLTPIPFQIDRRDLHGRFLIPRNDAERLGEGAIPFGRDDECVFMAADLGSQRDPSMGADPHAAATRIELTDPHNGRKGWAYALVFDETPPAAAARDYAIYDRGADAIESDTYRIAFSREKPFLVDRLHWRVAGTIGFSPDLADTMKVRHTGKLFHRLDFTRTEVDCRSTLLGVKDGPVRVIRSTSNRVRIFLQVKSPTIRIDYIAYPFAFFMDSVVRIPFRIGTFFSDVKTRMTLDGNNDPSLPTFQVFSPSFLNGLTINGKMTEEKRAFNQSGDGELVVASPYGKLLIGLQVARDFPIHYQVYLMDDLTIPDPPEGIPGQLGNVGFMTTGWDQLARSSYRMVLTVYMIRNISVGEALRTLREAPALVP
jgi:hypothetical protein